LRLIKEVTLLLTTRRNPIEEKLAIGAPLDFLQTKTFLSGMA
jgi:hypothetical protein